jgi:two-component system chemotaxis response regulator CheY
MKVLVVDDDVVSRMVLMHLVDACGKFDIIEAEDGQHAWDQLSAGLRPVVCFCDLRMPRMSGMDLLARIKAEPALSAMPFVLVTSATDRATVDRATSLGVAGYLVKPFEGDQVRQYLAPFLGGEGDAADAETARDTMARLGISAERLLVYLGGFQSQLTGASAEIAALIAGKEIDAARARLERLQAGCLTLGLKGAAASLRALGEGPLDPARVQVVLADTVRAVMHQSEAVKRTPN